MGGRHTSDWYEAARDMRRNGEKIKDIAQAFGRSQRTVAEVVKGVVCPVDHLQISYRNRPKPDWVERARTLRHSGRTYQDIADTVGTSKVSVVKYCRDIPYDGRTKRDPETTRRATATWRTNYEAAVRSGKITPKAKTDKPKVERVKRDAFVPGQPRVTRQELRRREIHRVVSRGMQDRRVTVTLPTIKSLARMDA